MTDTSSLLVEMRAEVAEAPPHAEVRAGVAEVPPCAETCVEMVEMPSPPLAWDRPPVRRDG